MTQKEVTDILATSSQNEWIVDDETGSFTYKDDLNLRIERAEYDKSNSFNEDWATGHPDSKAEKVNYTVKYASSFVARETLVSVDGGRATLPMPDVKTKKIVSSDDMNFAKIVDVSDRTDEYIERSGLTVQ